MTPITESLLQPTKSLKLNTTSINDDQKPVSEKSSGLIEDDPAYSTEARMILNLPGPSANRRSFDSQDGQNEFEILKVNNETPAIANYHEFYENLQSNLHRSRGTQTRNQDLEEPAGGRTTVQNQRTKDRIKKIEKYLTNFHGDQEKKNSDGYQQLYNYATTNKPVTQTKAIFEPEKVQTTFHQHAGSATYDRYNASPTPRPRKSSIIRTKYEDSSIASRQKPYSLTSTKSRHVNSKPVVVPEPSDYASYATQQSVVKVPNMDHYRNQKLRIDPEVEDESKYKKDSHMNREDRYDQHYDRSEDINEYADDENDYLEVTERPRRVHKNRRRPYTSENSRRLPKEHRGHSADDLVVVDSRKNTSPTRSKLHRPKSKPTYWAEDDRNPSASQETFEEQSNGNEASPSLKSEEQTQNQPSKDVKMSNGWSQVGPNIEVSQSNGFELNQVDKSKLLVPVNLNLVPLTNFDHSTALGSSQGFDLTNVPNFVTATPLVSSTATPLLSTSHSIGNPNIVNSQYTVKAIQNPLHNNFALSTALPDIILGQNTYQNPVQAVLLPHMNKFATNLQSHYVPSTMAPMFTVTQTPNMVHSTPRVGTSNQHQPQLMMPQPTIHSIPLLPGPYNPHMNYNIFVNPNGLHGQNSIQNGNVAATTQNPQQFLTTSQSNSITNLHSSQSQLKKNTTRNSNGQFLASASFSVGQGQQQTGNDAKFYLPTAGQNNNNNNNNYNQNQNNQARQQHQDNFYHIYGNEQNPNHKLKTYIHAAQVLPAIIHQSQNIPVNFNHQNYANYGQLQGQQSILSPIISQRPRDQNEQILQAANDIFQNTWKQLQQLQTNDEAAKNNIYHPVYRTADALGSTSNNNLNTINAISASTVKAHLPILSTQNVEILNPNIKPSPVDLNQISGYQNYYPAAVLTTPIPIFSTTAGFLTPRPVTSTETINLQNYVDSLTQIGAQSNQINKFEYQPGFRTQENQRPVFNPINFVPNIDLIKSQSMLNNQLAEPLPNQLNLVPLVPGGNFFKSTYGAQSELVQKPRLSNDLEKYAEEMFKESLKTIYSTHKWNNDRKNRGNYTNSELSDLAKLKNELLRLKDSKYSGKDILEAHHSETKIRTAEPSKSAKKPDLSIAAIEQMFKSESQSAYGSQNKNRPGHGSSRPGSSNVVELSDYLTPPKPNSFISKSPFIDSPKPKKRPGSSGARPLSRPLPRPSSLVSRPSSGLEASASNHIESGVHNGGYDKHHHHHYHHHHRRPHNSRDKEGYDSYRHPDQPDYRRDNTFDSYPTFTTTSAPETDSFKASSSEHSSKTDYYDINHPRMHNLLGLLMKNKQLPAGSSQSIFRDEDELKQYFENEKRRLELQFYEDTLKNFQKKADNNAPIDMAPPAPPKRLVIH